MEEWEAAGTGMEHRSSRGFWGERMDLNGVSPDPDQGQDQQQHSWCVHMCLHVREPTSGPRTEVPIRWQHWCVNVEVEIHLNTHVHTFLHRPTHTHTQAHTDKAMTLFQCDGQITYLDTIQPSPSLQLAISVFVTYLCICPWHGSTSLFCLYVSSSRQLLR